MVYLSDNYYWRERERERERERVVLVKKKGNYLKKESESNLLVNILDTASYATKPAALAGNALSTTGVKPRQNPRIPLDLQIA